jgi:hypothetical protein
MAVQSNFIVFIFFGLAGILLIGLIIFFVIYFSRSDKGGEVRERTRPLITPNTDEIEAEVEGEKPKGPSYTRLVTFGRLVSDDHFAVRFEDEWISDPNKLSLLQKNRLEKNLEEAQKWFGTRTIQESEVKNSFKTSGSSGFLPPLVPEKVVEKHKRQSSIVEQVDAILQDLLVGDPLEVKNIRLTEMPNKGVIVWVGNENFEGINAVPDEDVKKIIRQAVKKWEESAGA